MTFRIYRCEECGERFARQPAQARRSAHKYCSPACAGAAKRINKSAEQKKTEKAAYDAAYRQTNRATLKQKKAAYFARTYDPDAARIARASKADQHAAYIRTYYADPKRKAEKVAYDADRRAALFGPYSGAYKVYLLLKQRVLQQLPDKYERAKAQGYYDQQKEKSHA